MLLCVPQCGSGSPRIGDLNELLGLQFTRHWVMQRMVCTSGNMFSVYFNSRIAVTDDSNWFFGKRRRAHGPSPWWLELHVCVNLCKKLNNLQEIARLCTHGHPTVSILSENRPFPPATYSPPPA